MKMTPQQAVELAMYLAVTAKDRKDSVRCIEIAEQLSQELSAEQMKQARKNVENKLGGNK